MVRLLMLGGITLITLALTYVDIQLTVWNDAGWQLESVTKNKKNTKNFGVIQTFQVQWAQRHQLYSACENLSDRGTMRHSLNQFE